MGGFTDFPTNEQLLTNVMSENPLRERYSEKEEDENTHDASQIYRLYEQSL